MYAIKGVGLIFLLLASIVSAHSGRKDSQGGHHQRATGTYHFHDGPLVGKVFAYKAEGSEALSGGQFRVPEAPISHLWSQAGHALKRGRLHRAHGDKRDEHMTKSLDPKL